MSKRRLSAIAVGAAAAVALAGCVPFTLFDPKASPTPEPSNTGIVSGEERFYQQDLRWVDCGPVQCALVTVPLDWNNLAGDTVQVAISRHEATGKKVGSLLVDPGGPGGSGLVYGQYADQIFSPEILDAYDVIGFDPRGVGSSTPVVCYTDPADMDELLYGTYANAYGTEAWLGELKKREDAWAQACVDNTGPLLGHIDAASVARDMDVIRAVLGDDSLHYVGFSYGTYLGAVYAALFPQNVGRMVLDGAVDPQVGDLEALTTQMAGFESAFRAYMTDCLASSGCPFGGTLDQALADVRTIIDGIDAKKLQSDDGRTLDRATLGTAIAENLYSENYWADMSDMFAGLRRNDPSGVFAAADDYNGRNADGSYNGSLIDVYTAVTCLEGTLRTDGVGTLEGLQQIQAAAPTIGTAIAWDDYAVLDTVCSDWPEPPATLPTDFSAKGAPPILVIGTTNNPATPYAQAVSLAKQLSSGVLISYEGEGHTIYTQGVACIDNLVDDYLVKGTVPKADPMC